MFPKMNVSVKNRFWIQSLIFYPPKLYKLEVTIKKLSIFYKMINKKKKYRIKLNKNVILILRQEQNLLLPIIMASDLLSNSKMIRAIDVSTHDICIE